MAFTIPSMPIECRIWTAYDAAVSAYAGPFTKVACNLSPGRRVMGQTTFVPAAPGLYAFDMELLLPALTDIRASYLPGPMPADLVECPKQSQRFYLVWYVDDIAKGFANEHRFAIIKMVRDDVVFTDVTFPFTVPIQ